MPISTMKSHRYICSSATHVREGARHIHYILNTRCSLCRQALPLQLTNTESHGKQTVFSRWNKITQRVCMIHVGLQYIYAAICNKCISFCKRPPVNSAVFTRIEIIKTAALRVLLINDAPAPRPANISHYKLKSDSRCVHIHDPAYCLCTVLLMNA